MTLQSFARRFSRRNLLRTQWGHVTGRSLINLALIVVGAGLTAVSVDVFLNPNNVVPGGFTALAMFANRLWGWPEMCIRDSCSAAAATDATGSHPARVQ